MKKVLIVTHVSGFVPQFEMNNVRILQELGYEVHYASNFNHVHYGVDNVRLEGTGIVCHQVDFSRSPFGIRANWQAYRQLKSVMEEHDFALVHCHTPVGATYGRLVAGKYRKRGTRVIYTAHGFHFYKGAPLRFKLTSYPMEWWLAHVTDTLITINAEDYKSAQKLPLAKRNGKKGNVCKINSVGIDLECYRHSAEARKRIREELGIAPDTFVLISVGELNWNKNHAVVVEAVSRLKHLKLHYIICGDGIEIVPLGEQAKRLGIGDRVTLTGYRPDIPELLSAADAMVFPSLREGLGVAALEAMAAGVPVIASDNRGTREYMQDGVNGYVVSENDGAHIAESIEAMYHMSEGDYRRMQQRCLQTVERFGRESVNRLMREIYQEKEELQ
ncbi:MAG: glycosyltransferase family 4 protein [Lachnospiraceae bacterium]|nr:glycosyltransferase family 4 protein [Lachnospiraceae bacterium]